MSKSTLSIFLKGGGFTIDRHVEVPCRLPEAFNFKYADETYTADIKRDHIGIPYLFQVERDDEEVTSEAEAIEAADVAERILSTIKAALGIGGPVPPGSPLPAIALAYEAECAAYEASLKAFNALPVELVQMGLCGSAPDSEGPTGIRSPAARMLAKYVEHVVQNAAAQVTP